MKMKKHMLAGALAVGLGVGAASLPQGAVANPSAQVGHAVTLWTLSSVVSNLPWFQQDSAGCFPWTLSVHCTGTPPVGFRDNGSFSRPFASRSHAG